MSQVVKAIVATDTGERRVFPKGQSALFQDVFKAVSTVTEYRHTVGSEYRIGVQLGAKTWVSELETLQSKGALHHAIERTKRQVIEAIFGEFRQDFRMIEKAIWNHEMEEAGKLLHDMERKMFEAE